MSEKTRRLLGPELIWALLFASSMVLAASNVPPTLEGNRQLEPIAFLLPLVGVVFSFLPFLWIDRAKWWLLARICLAGALGIFAVVTKLCGAIEYYDSRNSGVGTGWMLFISLALMALMLMSAIAAVVLLWKRLRSRGKAA